MGILKNYSNSAKKLPREIYIIALSKMINSMGAFIIPLLTLILTGKIGMSAIEAGRYMTILMIMCAPGFVIGGKLVDTFGRKKILIIFQGTSAILLGICGFMPVSRKMTHVFMLSAIILSFSFPVHDAMVADITEPKNRKAAYGLLYMGNNLGIAIGPAIGGLLYENNLPLVFIFDALTTIISLILITFFIKETSGRNNEKIIKEERHLEKHEKSSVFKVLLERPILIYFAIILFIYNLGYSQWSFTLPLQIKDIFKNLGSTYYGLLCAFNGFLVIICTPIITKVTHHMKPLKIMAFAGIFYGISFVMFGFSTSLYVFFIFAFIMTIGEIMINTNSATFIANNTPASHRGRVSGIVPMIIAAGYSVGPIAMGKVISIGGTLTVWIIVSIASFIGAIIMYTLYRLYDKAHEHK